MEECGVGAAWSRRDVLCKTYSVLSSLSLVLRHVGDLLVALVERCASKWSGVSSWVVELVCCLGF